MTDSPLPPVDLDLRLVRYFTVLAAHGHFGRAAEALHLTQPSLSRQIQALEQRLGVQLLDRTPQGSRLTEAGRVFLPQARELIKAAAQAAARTRAAAATGRITIGFAASVVVAPAVRALRARHPEAEVRTAYVAWNDVYAALSEHRADAVVTRPPLHRDGLRVSVLYEEQRAVLLPLDHRLAGKESLTLDDISDEPVVRVADAEWNAYWRIDPRPDGSPAPAGPFAGTLEDEYGYVAAGQAVRIIPLSESAVVPRTDLIAVPLTGVEPTPVLLATRVDDAGRLVTAFRECAEAQLRRASPIRVNYPAKERASGPDAA